MASANHLDDLLNTVYDDSTYQSIASQSEVDAATTLSSVTLTTTGAPGMIGIANIPGENIQYKIVAISDTNNTITLEPLLNGTPDAGTQTDFALGFNSTGILISPNNEATVAGEYTSGNAPIADSLLSILSSAPIVSGTTETYTKTGPTGGGGSPQQPPASSLTVTDTTTGKPGLATVTPYSGPVAGLTSELSRPQRTV
jgi:hypothetical protein